MTYNKFQPGTVIEINGAEYLPHMYAGERLLLIHRVKGIHFQCEQPDGSLALPTDQQFDQMLLDGSAAIRTPLSGNQIRNFNEESEWALGDAVALDATALKRAVICELLDKHGIKNGNKAIEKAMDKYWTPDLIEKHGLAPSPRTIRGWRASRGYVGNRHPRHMVSLTGRQIEKVRKNDLNKQAMWLCVLNGLDEGSSVATIHADYSATIWQINEGTHPFIEMPRKPLKVLDERTIRRACHALESSETLARRIAKQAAEQDWLGAGKPLTADFVMQRVIIDHTWINVHVVCPKLEMVLGRPWLTLVIDVKSRAIVGYVITFTDPSIWTLGEALRRMALPKRPPPQMVSRYAILAMLRGKAGEVIVDNASEFRSHAMEAAARHAGFSVRFCPIKRPRYRAICERAIDTMNTKLCSDLPGRTLTIHDARRLGYNAEDHALVTLDELEAVANQIVADYNTSPHDGIGDRQPALVFEKDLNKYGINNFADFESFRRDTMDVVEDAQVSPSGVRAFGLRYHNIEAVPALLNDLVPMEPRRKRRDDATATVHFRYDHADISTIHVWNRRTRKYVELQCADENYADGMPMWLHKKIQDEAKAEGAAFNTEQERLSMRGRLVHAIRGISPRSLAESRKRVAQLLEIPRVKEITGNIVDLANTNPQPISLGDFISHDRAALTSLDHEILSSRPTPKKGRAKTALDDRREETDLAREQLPPHDRTRRNIAGKGGYA
ncbi:integrase catalytic domain-containing protein [Qipengyuania atrilutea]|uniref:Transposase family protein n=1 Tax=Qipengyuania atrilutea TaxID=2744473 RepID=A0A850H4I8_9SPHN|nr:DDE-type integrase/transposase/recombinase [Actirhodobacter atriluteus]NVD45102.1 transposase family protein [Actirhodobacter atriluteus]